jgi:hypothetical protein
MAHGAPSTVTVARKRVPRASGVAPDDAVGATDELAIGVADAEGGAAGDPTAGDATEDPQAAVASTRSATNPETSGRKSDRRGAGRVDIPDTSPRDWSHRKGQNQRVR